MNEHEKHLRDRLGFAERIGSLGVGVDNISLRWALKTIGRLRKDFATVAAERDTARAERDELRAILDAAVRIDLLRKKAGE